MKYRTIVADPPWDYPEGFGKWVGSPHKKDREKGAANSTEFKRIPLPYEAMTLGEIKALDIPAEKNARLFLWATNRYLPDAFDVLKAWGFKYRQLIVWDKRPNVNPLSGSVAPNCAEYLLVAQRGSPGRLAMWDTSIIQARKARTAHSTKPEAFLDFVEKVSPGPYLEMFARRNRLGWDTWGNEALNHVEIA